MARKILLVLCMLSFGIVNATIAQDKPPQKAEDEVIRVDTELIDIPLVVTDRAGKPVLNLKQKNFLVYEDDKSQSISDFAAVNAPFEVALLLDTSGSTRSEIDLIRRAAQTFIDSLRPGDRVSIVAFKTGTDGGRSVAVSEVLNPLTDNRSLLKTALEKVGTSNGTPYYDSLLKIAETVFAEPPKDEFRGRRALVALTDGVDSTSASDFDEAREVFEKAGVVCYFIKVDTQPFFEENLLGDCESAIRFSQAQIRRYYRKFYPNANIEKVTNFCQLGDFERLAISKKLYDLAASEMSSLAKVSGGRVFPVGELSEARNAFISVADEIGTKYSLGYYSSNEKRDGTFRRIRVELKDLPPGTQVRAREGYTARVR
ncbi:MAG TPA: VWA domain-containing protein [Pyrinomonadaceae bacterium]|nr:VWA domain-containing protein [Pyrinomonadaceae bacterium]